MGMDPRLAKKFSELERQNQNLQGQVKVLRERQGNQGGGNAVQRGVNKMLSMATLGRVNHPELYFGRGNVVTPPGFRKGGRLF